MLLLPNKFLLAKTLPVCTLSQRGLTRRRLGISVLKHIGYICTILK